MREKMKAYFFEVLDELENGEQYQVWIGTRCILTASGKELKRLVWERDALYNVAFACLR